MYWALLSDVSDITIHWNEVDIPDDPEESSTIVFNGIPTLAPDDSCWLLLRNQVTGEYF